MLAVLVLLLAAVPVFAGPLDVRVAALETQVATLLAQGAAQQNTINDLTARLLAVEGNRALELGPYVRVDTNEVNGVAGPHVVFEGVNLHLQNGSIDKSSTTINGLGNFLIGYNEVEGSGDPFVFGDRGGSHNLVVGSQTKFTSTAWGGIVQGEGNKIAARAVAIGGNSNSALQECSVAIGGNNNSANSDWALVIGGARNVASGMESMVLGGGYNTSVGNHSVVLGGANHQAFGWSSTITGGQQNVTYGDFSSVSGGLERSAPNMHNWVAGSLLENN